MKKFFTLFLLFFASYTLNAELNNRVIDISGCGLNFVHKYSIIAERASIAGNPGRPMPINFTVSEMPQGCFRVEAAYVWWIVSYTNATPVNGELTITDPSGRTSTVAAIMTGQEGPKCWQVENEVGTRAYRADIRGLVTTNGNYSLSVNTGGRMTDGITMMIFYRDLRAAYEGHVVIQDGLITSGNPTPANTNRTLGNFNVCANSTAGFAFMIVSDLQNNLGATASLILNGAPNTVTRNFWNSEVIPVNLTAGQNSSGFGVDIGASADCYSWAMMGLYYQTTTCRSCPEQLPQINVTATGGEVCLGSSLQLTANGAARYEWTSNPPGFTSNLQNPTVSPTATTTYTVRGVGADECSEGFATATVTVNPLPQPLISVRGATTICSCDSVRLDATNNTYTSYRWSTGATTPSIFVRTTGSYSVTVTDQKGCVNTSAPVTITVLNPAATIAPDKALYQSAPGDTLTIPVVLANDANLDFCNLTDFTAVVSFNSSLLVPVGSTPKGTITGDRRFIEVKGKRIPPSPNLFSLNLLTTLGYTETSTIRLESFRWDACQANNTLQNGNFSLVKLCYEDNKTRLYQSGATPLTLGIRPNPAEANPVIQYGLVEKGYTQIFVLDMLGRKVSTLYQGMGQPGLFEITPDISALPSGQYMIVLISPTDSVTEMMEVRK